MRAGLLQLAMVLGNHVLTRMHCYAGVLFLSEQNVYCTTLLKRGGLKSEGKGKMVAVGML